MLFLTAVLLRYTNHQYPVYIGVSPLSLFLFMPPPHLSGCVVTRGIMGLSYSRRGVDALNSNIKLFPAVPGMSSSLRSSCLTGLEGVQSVNHDTASNQLWQVSHKSCRCFLCKVILPLSLFFCQQKRKAHFHVLFEADVIPHKPFLVASDHACLQTRC